MTGTAASWPYDGRLTRAARGRAMIATLVRRGTRVVLDGPYDEEMLAVARRLKRWRTYPRRMWLHDAAAALAAELPGGWHVATDAVHGAGRPGLAWDTKAIRCGTWGRSWRSRGVDLYAYRYRSPTELGRVEVQPDAGPGA